jgi:hypothetical protein
LLKQAQRAAQNPTAAPLRRGFTTKSYAFFLIFFNHGYSYYNKYKGGGIILKIRGQESLIYLSINDLKART